MRKVKSLVDKLFTFSFLLVLLFSFIGLAAPLISAEKVPILQLIPAILVFITPIHFLAWTYFKSRNRFFALISILALLGSVWVGAKDLNYTRQIEPEPQDFRVLSYNAQNFNFTGENVDSVILMIQSLDADVICFQEFRNYEVREQGPRAAEEIARRLNMEDYIHLRTGKYFQGIAIFSRHPFISLDTLYMEEDEANNGLLATISSPSGPIGVGNFHLSSFQLTSIKKEKNTLQHRIRRLIVNSTQKIPLHVMHLEQVLSTSETYPFPMILAADMNTVPHSRAVHRMTSHFRDSFREKGRGLGWTYPLWHSLGVRIDYQFVSPEVEVRSLKVIHEGKSDHFPLLGVYRFGEIK